MIEMEPIWLLALAVFVLITIWVLNLAIRNTKRLENLANTEFTLFDPSNVVVFAAQLPDRRLYHIYIRIFLVGLGAAAAVFGFGIGLLQTKSDLHGYLVGGASFIATILILRLLPEMRIVGHEVATLTRGKEIIISGNRMKISRALVGPHNLRAEDTDLYLEIRLSPNCVVWKDRVRGRNLAPEGNKVPHFQFQCDGRHLYFLSETLGDKQVVFFEELRARGVTIN